MGSALREALKEEVTATAAEARKAALAEAEAGEQLQPRLAERRRRRRRSALARELTGRSLPIRQPAGAKPCHA